MSPRRIMLIGPKALYRSVASQVKRWKVQVVWYPRVVVDALLEPRPDVIILDGTAEEHTPGTGIDQIRRVHPSVPIILIVDKPLRLRHRTVTQVSRTGLLACIAAHFEAK